jgi:hypothetical protein
MGRSLALKSKMEFEGQGAAPAAPALLPQAPALSARSRSG